MDKSNKNCKYIKFLKDLVNNSYSWYWLPNTFTVFISLNNIFILIYSTQHKSIISYDIIHNLKINEIKDAHKKYICYFKHFLDLINKRDLILSLSSDDNNIKIWNNINFECLINIKNVNINGYLHSACFLKYNNQIYIISSNASNDYKIKSESIKVFDLKGNKINEINDSNEKTNFIDSYYDIKLSKYFIIICTDNYSKSYDYDQNKKYQEYCDNTGSSYIIVNKNEEITELIESNIDGNIRIWNFHSGLLLKKIKVSDDMLKEICLWDNEYLFAACCDKEIKLIEYNKGKTIKSLKGHKDKVLSIKKIIHYHYGECLLSQGCELDSIKLWVITK